MTLLVVVVIIKCFFTVACESSKVGGAFLIAKWTCDRAAGQDRMNYNHVYTVELYEGENCYRYYRVGEEEYSNFTGTWKVTGDILTITLGEGVSLGFVINTSKVLYILTNQIDDSIVLYKESN